MPDDPRSAVTPEEVSAALERICASHPFASSGRLQSFLRFVVQETLAGRADTLKAYTIGTVVYERGSAFDPKADSIVRTEARRLRTRLEAYYQTVGVQEPIRIILEPGSYVPTLSRVAPPTQPDEPAAVSATNPAPGDSTTSTVAPPSRRARSNIGVVWAAAFVALVGGALALLMRIAQPQALSLEPVAFSQPVPTGGISADGRYVVGHDRDGIAWRLDLGTSRTEKITFGSDSWDSQRVPWMAPSPDGSRVAYTWTVPPDRTELRVMAPPDGVPRVLRAGESRVSVRPVAWSGDDGHLLVVTTSAEGRNRLDLTDVTSGASSLLGDLGPVAPLGVAITRDGSLIAFDHAPAPGERDITVLDTRTGRQRRVVSRPGNDLMPVFVNDGTAIVFVSEEPSGASIWWQQIEGGHARGAPRLVKRHAGAIWALGATRADTLAYGVLTDASRVHVAALDKQARLREQPRKVGAPVAGAHLSPAWSPDGRYLAYVAQRGIVQVGPGAETLIVLDRAARTERRLQAPLTFVAEPRWSRDGTRLLVSGRGVGDRRRRLHIVDARTGALLQSLRPRQPDEGQVVAFDWAPEGDAVLAAVSGRGLVQIEVGTQQERVLASVDREGAILPRGFALTPGTRRVAYVIGRVGPGDRVASLMVGVPGGALRELTKAQAPDWLMLAGWAPDARSVFAVRQFRGRPGAGPERRELWRYPFGPDAPHSTGLYSALLRDVSMHPAGTSVAYVDGAPSWSMATLTIPPSEAAVR